MYVGHEHAVDPLPRRPRLIAIPVGEGRSQNAASGGHGQKLSAQADQPPGGNEIIQTHPAPAIGHHVLKIAPALPEHFHDRTLMLLFYVDHQGFDRFFPTVFALPQDHLGARDPKLIALPAHGLEKDGKVEFAPARYTELIRMRGIFDSKRHVIEQLLVEAGANLPARQEFAIAPGKGRGVDLKGHGHRGLVHREGWQGFHRRGVAERVRDRQLIDARDADDISRPRFRDVLALEPCITQHREDTSISSCPFPIFHGNGHARARDTTLNAAQTDDAHVAGVIQRADLHLEGPFRIHLRGGDMFHDGVEDEAHILFEIIRIATGTSKQRRGINGAEVELLLAGAKAIKEVKNFSLNPIGPCPFPVYLIDYHDGGELLSEGLAGNETGLRHGAVHGIHQQEHAIHHGEHALDFTTEVRVPRGIHNIDAHPFPVQRRVLREDRNTPLLF